MHGSRKFHRGGGGKGRPYPPLDPRTLHPVDHLYCKLIWYSKTCVKRPLSKWPKIVFQDQLSLNAGQNYCRVFQWEISAILSTFVKLPFVIKIFFCLFLSGRYTQVLLYNGGGKLVQEILGKYFKSKNIDNPHFCVDMGLMLGSMIRMCSS